MLKTLFLQAPSFDGFDGGAGSLVVKEMLGSAQMMRRRLREGVEFMRFLKARQSAMATVGTNLESPT